MEMYGCEHIIDIYWKGDQVNSSNIETFGK